MHGARGLRGPVADQPVADQRAANTATGRPDPLAPAARPATVQGPQNGSDLRSRCVSSCRTPDLWTPGGLLTPSGIHAQEMQRSDRVQQVPGGIHSANIVCPARCSASPVGAVPAATARGGAPVTLTECLWNWGSRAGGDRWTQPCEWIARVI